MYIFVGSNTILTYRISLRGKYSGSRTEMFTLTLSIRFRSWVGSYGIEIISEHNGEIVPDSYWKML